ncbi:MAG: protease pro-enzyme activation domain-containing protein [Terriglobia bacterium]
MRKARAIGVRVALVCAFVASFTLISKGQQREIVPARVTQAVDPENRVTLRGNTHPLARPEFDQGAAPDSLATERMLLVLKRSTEQETALRKFLDAQQTKSSANYHMWLTPEQFGQQFGPADADIQAVTNWLTSQGFQINRVAAGRTVIEFSGTAGAVRQALHTEIHKYVVNGEEHWANAGDPQIPAALAPVVAGCASLNNFPKKPMHHGLAAYTKSISTGQVKPSLTVTSNGVTDYALGPADFATIYNVPNWSAFTGGTGQTIAIVGQTNINPQDVDDFRTLFGIKPQSLPANSPCPAVSTTHPIPVGICLNGPDPGILSGTGDESESDLDVEWSGAIAPAATLAFVVSESTEVTAGIDLSALYIIDNNLAPVMTESYGGCEAALGNGGNAFYSTLWEQGAAQGISILEAAGDEGSAACDVFANTGIDAAQYGLNVVGNASTPFNVAVGGTDFNDVNTWSTYWSSSNSSTTLSSAMSYIPEMAWNDSCANSGSLSDCSSGVSDTGSDLSGGGGGESNCSSSTTVATVGGTETECISGNAKPSWQSGTGVPADGVRDLPDLSLFAGDGSVTNSFYVLCEADALPAGTSSCVEGLGSVNFIGVGGTSASVQAFGGIMALVNQKYGPQGVANYVLYPLAAKSGASCASTAAMAPTASSSSCVFYDTQTGNNSVACVLGDPDCYSSSATASYGILVNPNAALPQPAWLTTPGYDMATGLGTVNVANLVSQWNSVSFTPTTTTLTITPPTGSTLSNIPHGQPVSLAVGVSPSASTGDVSLLGGPSGYNASCTSTPCNLGIDFATLSGGSASGTTTMLPGGTYNVTARYAGDGTHAASTSSPVQVTVAAENSNTFLVLATEDCSGNITYVTSGTFAYGNSISCSGVYYSQYWLVMNVTNSTGSLNAADPYGVAGACFETPVYQCPTGQQVTVTLNGSALPPTADVGAPPGYTPGTYNLNSQGTAEDQFIQLPVGADTLVATYEPHPIPPNNSYNTSTSTAAGVTITKATTATSVAASPSNVASGATVSLTAAVNTMSFGLAPAGTVAFFNGSTQISGTPAYTYVPGSLAGPASLTATLSTSFTANASVTAQYSGDVNYGNSTSTAVPVTITATPDFGLSAAPSSFTITSPGASGSTTVSSSAINGFTGTVSITCALPASLTYSTCTLSASTLTPGGTGSLLTVATTAPSAALRLPNRPRWFLPGTGVLLIAWILLLLAAGKHRRMRLAFGLCVFAMLAAAFVACGGGSSSTPPPSSPGTPTGSYTVTVTGTSTVSGASVSHTLNIPVSVQ